MPSERSPVPEHGRLRRLGWLVLIWAASVAALAVVAGLFRVLMSIAGLTV
ncbi:DUF2474 family protein [Candidatus Phyllobacterium onerii]|jgi:hypothetical protein|nr:DUF2474 family protein [Phyllobacterium sp. IY22]